MVLLFLLLLTEAVLMSTHNLCFEQNYEKYQSFLSENFQFLEVNFSLYLNRRVFVMIALYIQTFWWKILFLTQIHFIKCLVPYLPKIPDTLSHTILVLKFKHVCFITYLWVLKLLSCTPDIRKTRLYKYIENFTSKNWKFSDKNLWYFSYFCSKHKLWVPVRTASHRQF